VTHAEVSPGIGVTPRQALAHAACCGPPAEFVPGLFVDIDAVDARNHLSSRDVRILPHAQVRGGAPRAGHPRVGPEGRPRRRRCRTDDVAAETEGGLTFGREQMRDPGASHSTSAPRN